MTRPCRAAGCDRPRRFALFDSRNPSVAPIPLCLAHSAMLMGELALSVPKDEGERGLLMWMKDISESGR